MSKKHKHLEQQANSASVLHTGEYAIIKRDLIRVIMLNVIYLAGVLALYFSDAKYHYLEAWFGKIFHF